VVVPGDDAGAHVVVPVPTADDEARLLAGALADGLVVDPLARYHLDPSRADRRHGIVVGYTSPSPSAPARAIEVLMNLLAG
jgi:GntR family transcriptional regulator/MocR family aminotransferase